MSTTDQPQPDSPAPAPEELVAYLDGELSPDECRRVEERLAGDDEYRQQLRALDQAWEALDSLPAATVDDDFARTTIEMVALAAREQQDERMQEEAAANRQRRRWWIAAAVAAVLASFAAARLLLPDANARLLADLPVITQMNLLRDVRNVAFLRQLSQQLTIEDLAVDGAAVDERVEQLKAAGNPAPEARRQWVESLTPEQQANLAAQVNQFNGLQKTERDLLRNLQQDIATAEDAHRLQRTLTAYGQWLNRRTSGEQSKLRSMAADERIRRIRDAVKQEERQAAWRLTLTEEDESELRNEINEIYNERKEEFARVMQRRGRDDRPRRQEAPPEEARALIVAGWALFSNYDIDDKTQRRMIRDLSDKAQDHLEQLKRRGGERRVKQQLWHWMHDAMRPQRKPGDLERYFADKLGNNERERLLSLPKDQMEAELEQMYLGSRFGLQGVDWLGSPGQMGRGPGPGGPGQPGWRPEGPPPFGGPDEERFERDRRRGREPDERRGRDDRRDPKQKDPI